MTNREYIESLPNKYFAYAVREILTIVGRGYADSIGGIELWLAEDYHDDSYVWKDLKWIMEMADGR